MEKCFTKLSPSSGVTSALFKVTFPHLRQTRFLSVRTRASSSCWILYFPLMCLFVLVYMLFFFLYPPPPPFSQGLWTEAHQCDSGAPEWQLPSAAGPWPVPRCLRRWCSPSAHCFFFFFVYRLWLWMLQPFNEQTHSCLAEAQGLQGSLYVWLGPQLYGQIAPSF